VTNTHEFIATGGYADTGLALRQTDISGLAAFVTLYPETAPEAIHATHHRLVWAAYPKHRTPEAISDAIDLPCSIVRKHLVELGYLEEPRPRKMRDAPRSGQPTWSAR
jgi:hypothetical protein